VQTGTKELATEEKGRAAAAQELYRTEKQPETRPAAVENLGAGRRKAARFREKQTLALAENTEKWRRTIREEDTQRKRRRASEDNEDVNPSVLHASRPTGGANPQRVRKTSPLGKRFREKTAAGGGCGENREPDCAWRRRPAHSGSVASRRQDGETKTRRREPQHGNQIGGAVREKQKHRRRHA
jgi:hypothetical protein